MDMSNLKNIAKTMGSGRNFEDYAESLGIKVLAPGEADPPNVSRLDSTLSFAIEERVAWITMSVGKYKPLELAKENLHNRVRGFLDRNKGNITCIRSISGPLVMDDVYGGCVKISIAFVGIIKQFAEDGTMIYLEEK